MEKFLSELNISDIIETEKYDFNYHEKIVADYVKEQFKNIHKKGRGDKYSLEYKNETYIVDIKKVKHNQNSPNFYALFYELSGEKERVKEREKARRKEKLENGKYNMENIQWAKYRKGSGYYCDLCNYTSKLYNNTDCWWQENNFIYHLNSKRHTLNENKAS